MDELDELVKCPECGETSRHTTRLAWVYVKDNSLCHFDGTSMYSCGECYHKWPIFWN